MAASLEKKLLRGPSFCRAATQSSSPMSQTVWMGEGQKVKRNQDRCQVLLAVAEVVFEVIAGILENVEGFVLDLPSCATAGGEFDDVVTANRQVGHEAVAVGRLAGRVDDFDLEPIDDER
jgi:hypothetical protein